MRNEGRASVWSTRSLLPLFGEAGKRRGRCQSAGKPDAVQTLRVNAGRGSMNGAPAFGVRGACSRFLEGQQWSRAMPKRRQGGRSPNASRQRALRIDEPRASIWSAWSLLPLSQPELKIIFHIHLVG